MWLLRSPEDSLRLTWSHGIAFEPIICHLEEGHQRGGRRTGPLSAEYPGKVPEASVLWSWYSECVIPASLSKALARWGPTGCETRPAIITANGRVRRHDFEELIVTGWGGLARPESGVRLVESCEGCGYLKYTGVVRWRRLFDRSQWDGSDFFMVWPLPRFIFVTHRVAKLLRESGFGGFRLASLGEMEPQEGLAPGRVTDWLSKEKARKVGVSADIF